MKLEFLYTDESYKEKIKDIKIGDSVTLSHTNESNLYIFSYEIKGENSDGAKLLSDIKIQVYKVIDKEKCFLIGDGASEYYNKQLYPLYNQFERGLRQVIALSAVRDGKEKTKQLARELEGLDFGEIYKRYLRVRIFGIILKKLREMRFYLKKT